MTANRANNRATIDDIYSALTNLTEAIGNRFDKVDTKFDKVDTQFGTNSIALSPLSSKIFNGEWSFWNSERASVVSYSRTRGEKRTGLNGKTPNEALTDYKN